MINKSAVMFSFLLLSQNVFASDLLSQITSKLKASDYPTGATSPDYKEDKEPHLADLIEKASQNKNKTFIPVMKQIASNKKMFWELRQEAIQYLCYFAEDKNIQALLKKYITTRSEPAEITDSVQKCLKK